MSRPIRPARPHPRARRLLAPISSLAACAGAAASLVVVTSTVAPSAASAAAAQPARHTVVGIPTFTIPFFTTSSAPATTASAGQPTSQAPQTTAATTQTTQATHSTAAASVSATQSEYKSTFQPQSLPTTVAVPSTSGACVPDNRAPSSGADMQLPQVNAGSTDPGYTNWLRLTGVGPSTMLPTKLNSANLSTLTLTRTADGESASLAMAASSGGRFPCALLDVSGGQGYQRIDYALTNAGFVSESVQGKSETLIVTYASISWSYVPTGGGAAHTGTGVINNQPNVQQTSLKQSAKLVIGGVLGLTAVCVLGMLLLTLLGRHRRKVRYREVRERSRVEVPLPERQLGYPQMLFATADQPTLLQPVVPQQAGARELGPREAAAAEASVLAEAAESAEVAVPEALRSVRVSEFAHARPVAAAAAVTTMVAAETPAATSAGDAAAAPAATDLAPESESDSVVDLAANVETDSDAVGTADELESEPGSGAVGVAASVAEPDLGGGAVSAGEAGSDSVGLSGSGGQEQSGEFAAEDDADGEAEDGGGGEQVGGAEAGLAADDVLDAEIGLRAGQQGDEPGDGEGQPGGGVPAGDELAAADSVTPSGGTWKRGEHRARDGDGDGRGQPGLEQSGVADPGEGGADDGVAEQPVADLRDDAEGEPEDGGGEGLQPGPGGDDEVVGGVEVDGEGDSGAQHQADAADDADDDVEDLDEPGGRGDVEGGQPVLDGGDQRPAGEQGEQAAGDDG